MDVSRLLSVCLGLGIVFTFGSAARVQENKADEKKPADVARAAAAAREKGLDWLVKHQAGDGSWGKSYTVGITGIGCLALLSASDEPFTGERGKALTRGLQFLLANQKDGMFLTQGQ